MKDFDFQPQSSTGSLLGSVVLPRSLTDLSIWKKTPFDPAHAIADLYLLANSTNGTHRLSRGVVVEYEAGECLWSNKGLAERWGWRRESVERFMVELEKSEIIRRREIDQYGKVIKLLEYEPCLYSQRTPNGQPIVQPTDTEPYTEGDGDRRREGDGGADPHRLIHLVDVLKYFETNGSGYSANDVTEQWLYYDAMRDPKTGEWQKPRGQFGGMVRISDWRSELANALLRFGKKKNVAAHKTRERWHVEKELDSVREQIRLHSRMNWPGNKPIPEKMASEFAALLERRTLLEHELRDAK